MAIPIRMSENQLLFYFEPKTYPYSIEDEKSINSIQWGHLRVVIVSANDHIVLKAFSFIQDNK